jgi:hypothetical protein
MRIGAFVARLLIDIVALDLHLEQRLAKHGNLKDFKVVLWRQELDATGCNWSARIDRLRGDPGGDTDWWDVVPRMREEFNLR